MNKKFKLSGFGNLLLLLVLGSILTPTLVEAVAKVNTENNSSVKNSNVTSEVTTAEKIQEEQKQTTPASTSPEVSANNEYAAEVNPNQTNDGTNGFARAEYTDGLTTEQRLAQDATAETDHNCPEQKKYEAELKAQGKGHLLENRDNGPTTAKVGGANGETLPAGEDQG